MNTFLPRFSVGVDAYKEIGKICKPYGKTCVLIYGKKAFEASKAKLLPEIENAGIKVVNDFWYGGEASFENADNLAKLEEVKSADMLFAIGGGKCIDTVKALGDTLDKPVFTFPTIASTCAAVTKLSVMYHNNGVFDIVKNFERGPIHTFIDTEIIAKSPDIYLWAGIGDTLAKYIECTFSARGDVLTYEQEFGVNTSRMCFYPICESGVKALEIKKENKVCPELENTILNIIISTGTVSICVGEDYNSALAHALNYGFSLRSHIEKNHYHGEVVSYGSLVQLVMDEKWDDFKIAYEFYKKIGLPTKLKDLEFEKDDPLDDVLDVTVVNKELEHTPYQVTKEMIRNAINRLEEINEKGAI